MDMSPALDRIRVRIDHLARRLDLKEFKPGTGMVYLIRGGERVALEEERAFLAELLLLLHHVAAQGD